MVPEPQSHLGFQATKNSDSKVRFLKVDFFVFIDLGLDQEVFHSFSLNKDWIFMWVLCVCYVGAFVFIGLELDQEVLDYGWFFFFFRKISIEKVSVHLKKKRDTEPTVKFLAAALSLAITGSIQ